jgi:glycosyltransferase involved in cell wall biosynthesis/GT2 family glycosyltransferase
MNEVRGPALRVSIVICTDGRAEGLANTLRCLQYLEGPEFEVCVVCGPTQDGTEEMLSAWTGQIKVAKNPARNLSISRNIGIAMAAGDLVAFIDDDALPEPEWLPQIVQAFDDPQVAGAGGVVMDHTGARPQYLYSSADRLGNADWARNTPADDYNFPLSFNFPYVQGTNCAFRRDALLSIAGFDEEYEYYLDETDVCCRLLDSGQLIRQLPDAVVHHKVLPSAIRTADRVTRTLYPVLKNKLYFSLVNNRGHYPVHRAVEDMEAFVEAHDAALRAHIGAGRLAASDLDLFRADVDRAWTAGLIRGLTQHRRLMRYELLRDHAAHFREFPRYRPEGGHDVFVFVSQEYPPGRAGGIGRYIHQMARSVASLGYQVHVITPSADHDRTDFEEGAWVHRIASRPAPPTAEDLVMPHQSWQHASTVLLALQEIAKRHSITAVYAPIWNCEGIAIHLEGKFPLVLGLQTTLHFWLKHHPHLVADELFTKEFAGPMLALERRLLTECDGIHAISGSISREISDAYNIDLNTPRTAVIPLGLDDWLPLPTSAPSALPDGSLRLLFVGRLEARKGIDVLFEALPSLLAKYPWVYADIVGDDKLPGPDGRPHRAAFEAVLPKDQLSRVRFHGEVSEDHLRGFYRACDIFVAPSRFESFGLILVEAMMFGKPVVAGRAGGMVEVVAEGSTALLADPGDTASLAECLEALIVDPSLRSELGSAGRKRYEQLFNPLEMAKGTVALLRQARARHKVSAAA